MHICVCLRVREGDGERERERRGGGERERDLRCVLRTHGQPGVTSGKEPLPVFGARGWKASQDGRDPLPGTVLLVLLEPSSRDQLLLELRCYMGGPGWQVPTPSPPSQLPPEGERPTLYPLQTHTAWNQGCLPGSLVLRTLHLLLPFFCLVFPSTCLGAADSRN